MKKRYFWADFSRIIAIFLVLVVHSTHLKPFTNIVSQLTSIGMMFAKTGVPIFVMLSGALLLDKKERYLSFFFKRMSRILLPWFFWAFISTIVTQVDTSQFNSQISTFSVFKNHLLSFWFLPMIVGLYFITPALRLFIKKAKHSDLTYIIILWFLVISFLPFARNTQAFPKYVDNSLLRQVLNFSGYYLIGYLIVKRYLNKKVGILSSISLSIFGLSWALISLNNAQTDGIFDISDISYHAPGIIILSTGVFQSILILSERLEESLKNNKYIISLSKFSLGIFLSHILVRGVLTYNLDWYPISDSFAIHGYANAVILFFFSILLIFGLNKIPILKKFIS